MLYYLFEYLTGLGVPGSRLMSYITFRSGMALVLSLLIAIFIGKKIIAKLQSMQVGEIIRDLDLEGQMSKKGTPTMGGIIIIVSILIPCLLLGNLSSVYMLLMIIATIWLGSIGFLDDYLKIHRHNKDGLKGKFKIVGQIGLGLIVGLTMYLNDDVVVSENVEVVLREHKEMVVSSPQAESVKAPVTTIPFVKDNNFNYTYLTSWLGDHAEMVGWILLIEGKDLWLWLIMLIPQME